MIPHLIFATYFFFLFFLASSWSSLSRQVEVLIHTQQKSPGLSTFSYISGYLGYISK